MKTIKILVSVSTRYVGSKVEEEIEVYVDDDATEEEIEQAKEDTAREWMHGEIEWGWGEIQEEE
jgi:hypothetical protein